MAILTFFFLNVVDQGVIIFDVFFVRVWLRLRLWGFGIRLRCRWFRLWFRRLWLWVRRNVMCDIAFMSFNA
jgi:hypothetical protein